jgi:hypothetical protein
MKQVLIILTVILYPFFSFGNDSFLKEVKAADVIISGSISNELTLQARMKFKLNGLAGDSIKIYLNAAGRHKETNAFNLEVKSVKQGGNRISIEDHEWILVPDQGEVIIDYSLNLKNISDWRQNFGYALFPGTYKDSNWYPDIYIDDNRNFFKDFKVTLEYPEKFSLLTSGYSIDHEEEGNLKRSTYKAENVRYFALNIGEGFELNSIRMGATVINYFSPPELLDTYKEISEVTTEAVRWYQDTYGFFPREYISIALGHPSWGGGFPSENLFYIHQGNLDKSYLQWITSHELGHYYWGLHTLSATEDELSPLMLANGIWIDHLYLSEAYRLSVEDTWNTGAHRAGMMERYLRTLLANREQEIGFTRKDFSSFDFDYNSSISHGKAAIGLYLISREVGFEQFAELQGELLENYEGQPLSTNNFLEFLSEKGHGFAAAFFNQWKKDHATIEYTIRDLEEEEIDGQNHYRFVVWKRGTVDYPIELKLTDEEGNEYLTKTKADKERETISGISESKLIKIEMDPFGAVPMWNSSNPAIQRNFILGMYNAGHVNAARKLAEVFSDEFPDDPLIHFINEL